MGGTNGMSLHKGLPPQPRSYDSGESPVVACSHSLASEAGQGKEVGGGELLDGSGSGVLYVMYGGVATNKHGRQPL
jgi:hypothetical protein